MSRSLAILTLAVEDLVFPLQAWFANLEALEYLCYRYGWNLSLDDMTFGRVNQALAFRAPLSEFLTIATAIRQTLAEGDNSSPEPQQLGRLLTSASALIEAIASLRNASLADLAAPLNDDAFWTSLAEHLFDELLESYLRLYQPHFYLPLRIAGIIRYTLTNPVEVHRRPYTRVSFDWGQLSALLSDPAGALKSTYKWGGHEFEHRSLFERLSNVLDALHVPVRAIAPNVRAAPAKLIEGTNYRIDSTSDGLKVVLLDDAGFRDRAFYELGIELFAGLYGNDTTTSGLIARPVIRGGASGELPLGRGISLRWKTALTTDNVAGVAIFPNGTQLIHGDPLVDGSIELSGPGDKPFLLLGDASGARVELYGPTLRLTPLSIGVSTHAADGGAGCRLVVPLDDSDSFVEQVTSRRDLELTMSPEVSWSADDGFAINGGARLNLTLPLSIHAGPITITAAHVSFSAAEGRPKGWSCRVGASFTGLLGPLTFNVDNVGATWIITPYRHSEVAAATRKPLFGTLDVDTSFAPPQGVGLAIDATAVLGGGYLRFDPTKAQYSGMLELEVSGRIAVKAFGLLTTRLPGGAHGYSLIILITVENFQPVPLGMGFELVGIGGMLAVHRTFDEAAMRASLRSGALDSVLMPSDPARNAPQIISTIDRLFPAASGQHIFGPVAKIAWGNPTLLSAKVSFLFEMGARQRLLLLAQISAILPDLENDVLRLQMDAVGVVEIGECSAALDATLRDSRLLRRFVLTGDMALRLKWKGERQLLLAVGGFHPAFNPPPQFPKLRRVALNLASGDNPRLRCEAYFAVTSNTVQFGARAELYAAAIGFSIQGETGFDVLIQRSPFSFVADFLAQVQLKRGTTNLFTVRAEGTLTGPAPLHLKAKATFQILWWGVTLRVDAALADGQRAPLPAGVDVAAKLKEAFESPSNWMSGPIEPSALVTLRTDVPATRLQLHPLAALSVTQGVVPLDTEIAHFGASPPLGERRFSVTAVTVQREDDPTITRTYTPADGAHEWRPLCEHFAAGQFIDMSDDEKLSRPPFEPMPAGIAVGSRAFAFGDDALEVSDIEFETVGFDTAGAPTVRLEKLRPEVLAKQAPFGAAGASPLRRTGSQRWRTALVDDFRLAPEDWAVAEIHAEAGPLRTYKSHMQASEALQRIQQQTSRDGQGPHLVRAFELVAD